MGPNNGEMTMEDRPAVAREMTRIGVWRSRVNNWLSAQRRRLPYLVWHGDDLDVRITFVENRLVPTEFNPDNPSSIRNVQDQLNAGLLPDIERKMREIGVTFDKGLGPDGRDWEWDWSLSGPVNIRFIGRASKPEKRGASR